MEKSPILVTLTGPSCAGKSHLERLLKERGFVSVTSVTTRKPRAGEVDGLHYHFVSHTEFADLSRAGELAEQTEFNDNRYGVTLSEMDRVADLDKPVVVVVDPHGAHQYREFAKKNGWTLVSIFVSNPPEVIARRFLERYREDIEAGNCKSLESHPARLAAMMTEERNWVLNSIIDGYDFVFDNFDGDSTEPIVNFIVMHADMLGELAAKKMKEAA